MEPTNRCSSNNFSEASFSEAPQTNDERMHAILEKRKREEEEENNRSNSNYESLKRMRWAEEVTTQESAKTILSFQNDISYLSDETRQHIIQLSFVYGDLSLLEILIDKTRKPEIRTQVLHDSLSLACENADLKTISWLLDKGADPKGEDIGDHLIFESFDLEDWEICGLFLEKGTLDLEHKAAFLSSLRLSEELHPYVRYLDIPKLNLLPFLQEMAADAPNAADGFDFLQKNGVDVKAAVDKHGPQLLEYLICDLTESDFDEALQMLYRWGIRPQEYPKRNMSGLGVFTFSLIRNSTECLENLCKFYKENGIRQPLSDLWLPLLKYNAPIYLRLLNELLAIADTPPTPQLFEEFVAKLELAEDPDSQAMQIFNTYRYSIQPHYDHNVGTCSALLSYYQSLKNEIATVQWDQDWPPVRAKILEYLSLCDFTALKSFAHKVNPDSGKSSDACYTPLEIAKNIDKMMKTLDSRPVILNVEETREEESRIRFYNTLLIHLQRAFKSHEAISKRQTHGALIYSLTKMADEHPRGWLATLLNYNVDSRIFYWMEELDFNGHELPNISENEQNCLSIKRNSSLVINEKSKTNSNDKGAIFSEVRQILGTLFKRPREYGLPFWEERRALYYQQVLEKLDGLISIAYNEETKTWDIPAVIDVLRMFHLLSKEPIPEWLVVLQHATIHIAKNIEDLPSTVIFMLAAFRNSLIEDWSMDWKKRKKETRTETVFEVYYSAIETLGTEFGLPGYPSIGRHLAPMIDEAKHNLRLWMKEKYTMREIISFLKQNLNKKFTKEGAIDYIYKHIRTSPKDDIVNIITQELIKKILLHMGILHTVPSNEIYNQLI